MTDHRLHFIAIGGSLRQGSYTWAIAETLDELAPDDVEVKVAAELDAIPIYNQDLQDAGFPTAVTEIAATIGSADAVIIVSPEYNHSIPGFLKNLLDWLSRLPSKPLAQKPVAIQTASPGALGGARAHEHVRQVLAAMDATILNRPEVIVTGVAAKVDAGLLKDPASRQQVARQLSALTKLVRANRAAAMSPGNPDRVEARRAALGTPKSDANGGASVS